MLRRDPEREREEEIEREWVSHTVSESGVEKSAMFEFVNVWFV